MKRLVLIFVPWALLGALASCGGDGGSSGGGSGAISPDAVTVTASNADAATYRLVVQTYDSSTTPFALTEQIVADPLPAAAGGNPGTAAGAVILAPTSAVLKHYFGIRNPSTGALLGISAEYVKGPAWQAATVSVAGQAVTAW